MSLRNKSMLDLSAMFFNNEHKDNSELKLCLQDKISYSSIVEKVSLLTEYPEVLYEFNVDLSELKEYFIPITNDEVYEFIESDEYKEGYIEEFIFSYTESTIEYEIKESEMYNLIKKSLSRFPGLLDYIDHNVFKCKLFLKDIIYWKHMDNKIYNMIKNFIESLFGVLIEI
ncbi:hypothetical protein [Dasineura jujubifolia toursvirus 2a]|nr:hypothetical protein [Dasineura jujubifolia toursvirus 2a]